MAKSGGSSRSGRGGGSLASAPGGAADMAAIDAEFGETNVRANAGIAPTGRAPRGQGQEYADRRAIASQIDTLQNRIANLQQSTSVVATRRNRFNLARNRSKLAELRQTLSASVQLANGPGDWGFKRTLIRDFIDSTRGT